ncbi:MAG: hypothetical protein JRN35_06065 [Nitrososphaerota archaeon]|nr:hypothetical protein [Nitrososphaerota archaeon]
MATAGSAVVTGKVMAGLRRCQEAIRNGLWSVVRPKLSRFFPDLNSHAANMTRLNAAIAKETAHLANLRDERDALKRLHDLRHASRGVNRAIDRLRHPDRKETK